jgi:hypothetical protein
LWSNRPQRLTASATKMVFFQRTGAFFMAESDVVTALSTRHAEPARLIEHQQKEMGRLADVVAHRGH